MLANSLLLKFKPAELHNFNWFFNVSPCFPVSSNKINIITNPRNFYDTLWHRFKHASQRITIASLYIGTGTLEKELLDVAKQNIASNKNLKLTVLLDYQRGTRGNVNSKSLLQEVLADVTEQCKLFFYQTPRLQGTWSRAVPARYNELVGLQHMKLYIVDDYVLLSGANFSNDYFVQRQDRYVEIQDSKLADFYSELIGIVNSYSKECCTNGFINERNQPKGQVVYEMNETVTKFVEKWKENQILRLTSDSNDLNADTWIFPLIQMGEFNIKQDEQSTQGLIESAPEGSHLHLATGYFNLTQQYSATLLNNSRANISLLMAHPNANGFLGASGPAGGIPHAYSCIAKKFWNKVLKLNQASRIEMLEYERPGWTFHAKGLWYYPPGSTKPWVTVVGSANLGERSVKRDLEAQAAIFTVAPGLQEKLHQECKELHKYSSECSSQLQERPIPLWVQATVGLFRTYF